MLESTDLLIKRWEEDIRILTRELIMKGLEERLQKGKLDMNVFFVIFNKHCGATVKKSNRCEYELELKILLQKTFSGKQTVYNRFN